MQVIATDEMLHFPLPRAEDLMRLRLVGNTRFHSCGTDWAVAYVVENKKCDESGSNSQRNLRAIWHFSVIPSAGFVNWDEEKHIYVNAAGKIWQ